MFEAGPAFEAGLAFAAPGAGVAASAEYIAGARFTADAEFAKDASFTAGQGAEAETAPTAWSFAPPPRAQFAASADPHPYPGVFRAPAEDEILVSADEIVVSPPSPEAKAAPQPAVPQAGDRGERRSKRSQAGPESERRSETRRGETRRGAPRHAAPSARFSARRSARLGTFPLAARG